MIRELRKLLWRILGVDYDQFLRKSDYTLLKDDKSCTKGLGTYDNGAKVWRWSKAPLVIGRYCSIAHNVNFLMDEGFHSMSQITNYPFINNLTTDTEANKITKSRLQKEGITVGNDVWIGINAVIMPGVKIGNGVTIAAGSVVNRDVPDYALVAGIPAKLVKMKHSDETIKKLQEIQWWEWSEKKINDNKADFYLDIEEFLKKHS